MKKQMTVFLGVISLVAMVFLTGFGEVAVYKGIVSSIRPSAITIIQKNGGQKTFKINDKTVSFVSGKHLPARRIKPNSHVEIAVDRNNVCLQIVVEEAPK